jgi:hypothetical protein
MKVSAILTLIAGLVLGDSYRPGHPQTALPPTVAQTGRRAQPPASPPTPRCTGSGRGLPGEARPTRW